MNTSAPPICNLFKMSLLRLDTCSVTEVTVFYFYAYLLVCDPVAIMDDVFYDIILFCKSWTILMIKTYVKMIQGKKENKTKQKKKNSNNLSGQLEWAKANLDVKQTNKNKN